MDARWQVSRWMKETDMSVYSVEVCLTSNVKCQTVESYDAHHFRDWYDQDHPIALCVCHPQLSVNQHLNQSFVPD